jgi:hypothetical protein
MSTEKEIKKEVFAITLIVIIFISLIGTFTILSVTEKFKPKTTEKVTSSPGVSLTILEEPKTEQKEGELTNGDK